MPILRFRIRTLMIVVAATSFLLAVEVQLPGGGILVVDCAVLYALFLWTVSTGTTWRRFAINVLVSLLAAALMLAIEAGCLLYLRST